MTRPQLARNADSGMLSPAWAGVADVNETLGDRAWLQAMLDFEVALAQAQADAGIIPHAAAAAIAAHAQADRIDLGAVVQGVHEGSNPTIPFVAELMREVATDDPGAADHVHRGSTSQDVLDSAAMLVAHRALTAVLSHLDSAAAAAARLADEHRGTVMVARTLTQHAVPTTFGVKATAWLQLVLDARRGVVDALDHGLPVSLGGAGGTLAAYDEYARMAGSAVGGLELAASVARRLGLSDRGLPWHTVRTPIAALGSLIVLITGAFGKIATDVHGMARTEVGEVTEHTDLHRGISTAMPQKHNPVKVTVLRAAAAQGVAAATVLVQALVAEDERPAGAWQSEWQPLREGLRVALGVSANGAELLEGLQVHPERLARNLELTRGAVLSERVSARLAPVIGKRRAKALLGEVLFDGGEGGDLVSRIADRLAQEGVAADGVDIAGLMDPRNYLGAAEDIVDAGLARYRVEPGR